jgi:putative ABC transport system permease protein
VFRPEEEQLGKTASPSWAKDLWKSRFGADPRIVGKQIEIDAQKFTVVGVVDPVLQFMEQAQLYVPLAFTPAQLDPNARGHQNIDVVARLKPGVTLDQARAEMKLVAARMTRNLPDWYPADWNIELDPLAGSVAGELRTPLLVLLGAVGMVLLIGCVNVANLLLARATARQKEIGLRIALGAGRARIVRQLLTESLLLAAISGAAGLAIGVWVLELFVRFGSPELLRWQTVRINGLAVLFAVAAAALLTSLVFGLAPALSASQLRPARRSRSSSRLRSLLVVSEVALSVMLLAGAGLLLRSYARLWQTNPGFRAGAFADRAHQPAAASVSRSGAHYRVLFGTAGGRPGAARRGFRGCRRRPAVWRGAAMAAISRLPAAPGPHPKPFPMCRNVAPRLGTSKPWGFH